jgi:hypothetical protein
MSSSFPDAFAPIAPLAGAACELVGFRAAELAVDARVEQLDESERPREGAIEAVVFDWSALSADERGELIVDFLGDAFLDADGDYVALHAGDTGAPAWLPTDLVPFALVGPPGLTERGATWDVAGSIDAVLFLDLAGGSGATCPVIAWFVGPTIDLFEIAPNLASLGLRPLALG